MTSRTGLDVVLRRCPPFPRGRNVGLLSNTGAVGRELRPVHEAPMASPDLALSRLFAHEHGL